MKAAQVSKDFFLAGKVSDSGNSDDWTKSSTQTQIWPILLLCEGKLVSEFGDFWQNVIEDSLHLTAFEWFGTFDVDNVFSKIR